MSLILAEARVSQGCSERGAVADGAGGGRACLQSMQWAHVGASAACASGGWLSAARGRGRRRGASLGQGDAEWSTRRRGVLKSLEEEGGCKVTAPRPTRPWPIPSRTSPSSRRRGRPAPRGEGQINRANTHVSRLIYSKDTQRGDSREKSPASFAPHPRDRGGVGWGRAGGAERRKGATSHSSCSAQLTPKRACSRRVQLVQRDGRDVSTLYGREGGG